MPLGPGADVVLVLFNVISISLHVRVSSWCSGGWIDGMSSGMVAGVCPWFVRVGLAQVLLYFPHRYFKGPSFLLDEEVFGELVKISAEGSPYLLQGLFKALLDVTTSFSLQRPSITVFSVTPCLAASS